MEKARYKFLIIIIIIIIIISDCVIDLVSSVSQNTTCMAVFRILLMRKINTEPQKTRTISVFRLRTNFPTNECD